MAENMNNNEEKMSKSNLRSVSIIGTGDLARALAKRLAQAGKQVFCGSRFPSSRNIAKRDPEIGGLDVQVIGIQQAIQKSDVIFLAVHSSHVNGILDPYKDDLINKILVDMSNPDKTKKSMSQAEQVAARYPNSHVVKGYNTLSAYALENSSDQGDNQVHIASDHKPSLDTVDNISQSMGLETVTYSTLAAARQLERRQKKLFRGWGKPLVWSILVVIAWTVFCIMRFHKEYRHPWQQFPLHTINKVLGLTAITLLGLCYLPGCIASIAQLVCCTKHRAFAFWLDAWLKARKQLGLLALWFGIIHGITSVAHNNSAYYRVFYGNTKITVPGNLTEDLKLSTAYVMNWVGETTYILGAVAIGMMGILGVTSLPSVGSRLNWKQWVFVQSYLGHACLAVSIAHVFVQGWPYLEGQPFESIIKGVSTISLIIPMLALALRLILLLPCFSIPLYKIRRGWECCRSSDNNDNDEDDFEYKKDNKNELTTKDNDKSDLTTNNPLVLIHKEFNSEINEDKTMLTTNIDDVSLEAENETIATKTALDDVTNDVSDDVNSNSSGSRESGIDNPAFSSSQEDDNTDSVSSGNRESSHSDSDQEERQSNDDNVHIQDDSYEDNTHKTKFECEHNDNQSSECERNDIKGPSESEQNDKESPSSSINDINTMNSEVKTDTDNAENVENNSDTSTNNVEIERL